MIFSFRYYLFPLWKMSFVFSHCPSSLPHIYPNAKRQPSHLVCCCDFFPHDFFFFFSFRETKNYLCIWLPVFLFPYNFSSRMYPGGLSLSLVMVRCVRCICSGPPLVGPPMLPSPVRRSSLLVHAATCALPAVITLTGVFPCLLNEILVDAMDGFRELLRKGGW